LHFTLRKDQRARDGARLQATQRFVFDTGGPAIRTSLPYQGATIDEDQVFLFALDAAVIAASVERAAYCAIDGLAERVPVRVLAGEERSAILDQRRELGYSYYQILWKQFSAPVPAAGAAAVRIVTADGSALAPEPITAGVASVERLTFKPQAAATNIWWPSPANSAVSVHRVAHAG
jgi:hypothetical protein